MDISAMTTTIVGALLPALPFLKQAGEEAVKKVGGKLGEAGWELAQRLWGHLQPKLEASPAGSEAVADVIAAPENLKRQAVLEVQIEKLLEQDPALMAALVALLQENATGRSSQVQQQARDGAIQVGENRGTIRQTNRFGR